MEFRKRKLPQFLGLFILIFTFCGHPSFAQQRDEVEGVVYDTDSGEPLPGANIYWAGRPQSGVVSDENGRFRLQKITLPAELVVSFIGFQEIRRQIQENDKPTKIYLRPEEFSLSEVVVSERRPDENVKSVDMGKSVVPIATIKNIPALFGEVDILRSLQMLPGIQTAGEGTTGLFVRGGSADQNLVQLDGAPIYNPSHFFGFFSVFNPDAIDNVSLYKGNIPAQFGGRLSSLVDVSLKEGNTNRIRGEGGIGTISSRLTIDGPINDKVTFVASGRRTYADIFLGLSSDPNIRNNSLYFYDLSGKVTYRPSDKDKITVSSYYGNDFLGLSEQFGFGWTNWVNSAVWNRTLSDKLYLDVNAYHSSYNYAVYFQDEESGFAWDNLFSESGLRGELVYMPKENLKFHTGVHTQYYHFSPLNFAPDENSNLEGITTNARNALQYNLFLSSQWEINPRFSAEVGLRKSFYQQIGSGVAYEYENGDPRTGVLTDTLNYGSFQTMQTYSGWEPRAALRYLVNESSSLKASYNRNYQYLQVASNSSAGLPIDRWVPADRYMSPISSDQYSVGYFKNLVNNRWEFSVEAYYKDFQNIIDLKQGANVLFTDNVETEILAGRGWAYGAEFLIRKNVGSTTGWVGYTYSRTYRQIEGISLGQPFNPRFDRPHDLNVVVNQQFNPKWSASLTFVYTTGQAVTFPIGIYEVDNQRLPLYSDLRNEDRFPDYHRMDVSINYKAPDKGRKWRGSWNFSVYNVYGRKNPFSYQFAEILNETINFRPTSDNPVTTRRPGVVKTYLFTYLPSLTYNFEF
ncbi:TonB-dependent receptor [Litoribacter alkaliphilus]|uniref:TonB-dependent receptor n=1 Tax=Litoribacter ruber TaxID=702568 RepID=A0AAP2G469_9BACT|nr:TonB-dependent receptor [Litoribacter alkaliphilus]